MTAKTANLLSECLEQVGDLLTAYFLKGIQPQPLWSRCHRQSFAAIASKYLHVCIEIRSVKVQIDDHRSLKNGRVSGGVLMASQGYLASCLALIHTPEMRVALCTAFPKPKLTGAGCVGPFVFRMA